MRVVAWGKDVTPLAYSLKSSVSSPEASVSFLYTGAISLEPWVWLLTFEGYSIIWNKSMVFLKVLYRPLHFLSRTSNSRQLALHLSCTFQNVAWCLQSRFEWLILVFAALFIRRRMAGNWFMKMCFVLQRKACCFLSCLVVARRFSSCCFSL